jgi:hypothetical protein
MQALHSANGLIRVAMTQGDPPELYVMQFLCRGVAAINADDQPVVSENHRATLVLTAEYPRLRPLIRWLTPIYHPNFDDQGGVCLREWYPSQSLSELCQVLGELVQYKNYDTTSPLNLEAAMWAIRHRNDLPIDRRNLLEQPALDTIEHTTLSQAPERTVWPSVVVTGTIPIWMPPETPAVAEALPRLCANCGKPYSDDDAKYCPSCGVRLGTS